MSLQFLQISNLILFIIRPYHYTPDVQNRSSWLEIFTSLPSHKVFFTILPLVNEGDHGLLGLQYVSIRYPIDLTLYSDVNT